MFVMKTLSDVVLALKYNIVGESKYIWCIFVRQTFYYLITTVSLYMTLITSCLL